jgi:hypothetical protein
MNPREEETMKIGNLVRIKSGSRLGKLAIVVFAGADAILVHNMFRRLSYYRRDLEVIA